ncbi:MAG: LLM class flavin-dependent oxidoreductase [Chloroflexota bacterium]
MCSGSLALAVLISTAQIGYCATNDASGVGSMARMDERLGMKVGLMLPIGNHAGMPEPWPTTLLLARRAEALRLDGLWVPDHALFRFPGEHERGAYEAWSVASALATATTTIPLGTLVLGLRFRNPALLAKMAATTDEISGGRLTLGVGAGWHDPEYQAFGYPLDHRLGRTEEAFELLVRLIREGRASMDGRWVRAVDAAILPPARPGMRILSSARGGRMVDIVARLADAANIAWVGRPDDPVLVERMAGLDAACEQRAGRDRDPRAHGGREHPLPRHRARGIAGPDQAHRRRPGRPPGRGGRPAGVPGRRLSGGDGLARAERPALAGAARGIGRAGARIANRPEAPSPSSRGRVSWGIIRPWARGGSRRSATASSPSSSPSWSSSCDRPRRRPSRRSSRSCRCS